jgi:hypothetical protein
MQAGSNVAVDANGSLKNIGEIDKVAPFSEMGPRLCMNFVSEAL